MQELEQRLLEAEQRAENAGDPGNGEEVVGVCRENDLPDPSRGHLWTHQTDVVRPKETCFLQGRGKPAVMC